VEIDLAVSFARHCPPPLSSPLKRAAMKRTE
jgi:hypothetical protein